MPDNNEDWEISYPKWWKSINKSHLQVIKNNWNAAKQITTSGNSNLLYKLHKIHLFSPSGQICFSLTGSPEASSGMRHLYVFDLNGGATHTLRYVGRCPGHNYNDPNWQKSINIPITIGAPINPSTPTPTPTPLL